MIKLELETNREETLVFLCGSQTRSLEAFQTGGKLEGFK